MSNTADEDQTILTSQRSLCCILMGLADRLCKPWKLGESKYKIIAIDIASRYCVNGERSANARPNLKTGARMHAWQ